MTIFIALIKVILTVLIVLVALVLIAAGLILFVPLRYSIDGSFKDETGALRAEVKWLLGFLRARAAFNREDGAVAYISVCGFKVYDIFDKDTEEDADAGDSAEIRESYVGDAKGRETCSAAVATSEDSVRAPEGEARATDAKLDADTAAGLSHDGSNSCEQDLDADDDRITTAARAADRPKLQVYKSHGRIAEWYEYVQGLMRKAFHFATAPLRWIARALRHISDWISNCIDRVEAKLRDIFSNIREMAAGIRAASKKRSTQLRKLKALWEDSRFAKGKALLIDRIKKLMFELRPRAGSGRIRIGRDDPYETGQMMQVAAMLYPLYGECIEVVPDFDHTVIEGELNVRGRLRVLIVAEATLKVFFNRELRAMYKRARHVLELD